MRLRQTMRLDVKLSKRALFIIWLSILSKLGECIKCVQCTTLISRECEHGYVEATECKPRMTYCIKYVGMLNSGAVVFRDCNDQYVENMCTMKMMGKHNDTPVRVCYETCDSDGCNGGPANQGQPFDSFRVAIITFMCITFILGLWR